MLSDKNGIHDFFGYDIPMDRRLELIKAAGFDAVSIWGLPETDVKEEAAQIRRLGLELDFIHAPFTDTGHIFEEDDSWKTAYEHIELNIRAAAELGARCVVAHITSWHHPKVYTECGIERLKQLVGLGEKLGVGLAVENVNKPAALFAAFSAISSPYFGFCFDSGHQLCFSRAAGYLPRLSGRLMALHLHDNDTSGDKHALPGAGAGDWQKIMGQIAASPYEGPLFLEVNADNTERYKSLSPEEFLAEAMEKAGWLRSLVNRKKAENQL